MATTGDHDTVDWRQARQWLIDSGVIPPTHRVTKPDVALVDFARSLRDGVFLCSLLNRLQQGSVDFTARPVMQHSYIKNINAFLFACKHHFNLKDPDLFTDSELYDVDNFSKVMLALSKLSHTQQALNMGWKPFPNEDDNKLHYNEVSGEDIYASLQEVSAQSAVYANIQDLYQESPADDDSFGYGSEKIYDSVCYYEATPVRENDYIEKKKSIVTELYETEKSFLLVLQTIAVDYYDALKDQSLEDLKQLFDLSQKILPYHVTLRDGLCQCMESKPDDVGRIFLDAEEGLLLYGMYAAHLPEGQERAKLFQAKGETSKLMQATMDKHQQRFPLSDLLPVPIQRILRYPLLIKELEKCTKKSGSGSSGKLTKVIQLLEDVGKYINTTKEHFEKMKAIQELESTISEYKGPKLSSECGHYHMDGELRIHKLVEGQREEPKSSRWVFLFDKVLLITHRRFRFRGMSYSVKDHHDIADIRLIDPVSSIRAKNAPHSFKIRVEKEGRDPIEYIAYAKTEELKFKWTESINKAKEVIRPKGQRTGHHSFELVNFDTPARCSACHKFLYGCYFQGYKCTECKAISHADCLEKQPMCSSRRPPLHPPISHQSSLENPTPPRRRTGPGPNGGEATQSSYFAKQSYVAIGPRTNTFLSFEKGDEIIVKETDHEWWEGVVVRTGQRGYVSPHYLKPQSQEDAIRRKLAEYSWYVGMRTRIEAEVALHRARDGVFLIRESMDRPGEYAVALKWNGMPKHIKIMRNPQTERFYVSDACDFDSIQELVEYYQRNTLGVSFPGVDTTLRIAYSDVPRHPSLSGPSSSPMMMMSPPPFASGAGGMWVEAVCDYDGEGPGFLSFHKHDHVKVVTRETQRLGLWLGEFNGKTGLFRSDHTVPLN